MSEDGIGVDGIALLRRMFAHTVWADRQFLEALRASEPTSDAVATAWREYAHVLGADAVWLSRLEEREQDSAVWPSLSHAEIETLHERVSTGLARYLDALDATRLASAVRYRNSLGQEFTTPVHEILSHVVLHAQYHRGKINALLRQAEQEPVPADFISYVRGVPAAVTPPPPLRRG